MRRSTRKRSKKTRSRGRTLRGGLACPNGYPPRMCEKYMQKWKSLGIEPEHIVTPNFKSNLKQSLYNREKRLKPEEVRVAEARAKFNWKSRVPKFNAIRKGEGIYNNISNSQLLNVHEATDVNFPEPTGRPHAFNTFTGPPAYGPMREKIYRNNIP